MTNQQRSLEAAMQAQQLLQQITQELGQAVTDEQIEKARKQLREVHGMVEQSEQHLYTLNARE